MMGDMGYSRASRTSRAVLNEAAVRRLRLLFAQGTLNVKEQAELYNVGRETIRRIARWETLRWVSEEGEGATREDWVRSTPTEVEIQASLQKVLAAQGAAHPSLEEVLRRDAEAGAEQAARAADALKEAVGKSPEGMLRELEKKL